MSRKPQAMGNLEKAKKVRATGAPTKIHADPEVKQYVDYYLAKGGESNRTIHKYAVTQFGKERAPSLEGLNSYVKRYWKKENSVTVPKTVIEVVKDFNALQALKDDIDKLGELCERFFERQKEMGLPMETVRRYYDSRRENIVQYIKLGIQLGLITGSPEPPSTVIGNMTVNQTNVEGDVHVGDASLLEQLIEIEKREKEYADSNTDESSRKDVPEATVQQ